MTSIVHVILLACCGRVPADQLSGSARHRSRGPGFAETVIISQSLQNGPNSVKYDQL